MSIIEKIRRRVEKADQQLGAGAAQNRNYAQRLTKLLDRLEIEHEGRKVRTERLHLENDELRAMLLSLLLGIEAESDLDAVLQNMETRMTALVNAATDRSTQLIGHGPTVIEVTPDPLPAAAAGRMTLQQALDQLMELVDGTEDAPKSQIVLNPVRSPAISNALDLLRAAVSEEPPAAAADPQSRAEPAQNADTLDWESLGDDEEAPEESETAPDDGESDSTVAADLDTTEFETVEMAAGDVDAVDFDSVVPASQDSELVPVELEQPENSEPVDLAASEADSVDFDPAGSGPEDPEAPTGGPEEAADAQAEPSPTSKDDGDPGIRKILEHVREEIEAKRDAAG